MYDLKVDSGWLLVEVRGVDGGEEEVGCVGERAADMVVLRDAEARVGS